ncbi:hypothetical protein ASG60_01175 [Methylobacterium sp. Leaf469]|jgi:hypothetical protein|uniref:hypothetical protein n=1 Tax=unclassified Methylobacterium TaxID=2615210 RepID=UPI0006FFFF57|nr:MULTISPECIES: hypothetical protein [unclassified Methylobacterium]KQO62057.1 hypothetical protein ASF22_06275 [Methylobacterium sp. Leaf87]KQP34204.1 hypothetical protein ASF27_01140 [Methylobacterium sp. Leaf102]KQU05324.1 hypothetical protein ASG60_01175 [Methylobacterium sp. Leaf469]USU33324.1 hypothetical protein NG677_06545 [Methylobacterium sp. OTU13CASTA1]
MTRTTLSLLSLAIMAALAGPASAIDGHGNAANPSQAVPNTGSVSGGPAHRDDPHVSENREVTRDGKPVHSANDGHAHGHTRDKK